MQEDLKPCPFCGSQAVINKNRDEEDGFCTGRGWPCQMVSDDGFCDKGKKK